MSRERADKLNTAAMLQQIQGMEQRLFEMQEKLDGFHALLSTTLTKFSQLEQMVTLQKVQQTGNGPTEV